LFGLQQQQQEEERKSEDSSDWEKILKEYGLR